MLSAVVYCIQFSMKTSRLYTIIGISLSIFMIIIPFFSLYLTKILIDLLTQLNQTSFKEVIIVLLFMYGLSILNILLGKAVQYIQNVHNDLMERTLQMKLMEKSMSLDLEFFDKPEYIDAMQAARMDAGAINSIVWSSLSAFGGIISFISAFVLLGSENWIFAILVTLTGIPYAYFNQKYAKDMYRWRLSHMTEERQLEHIQMAATTRIFACDVRLFAIESYLIKRCREICKFLIQGRKQMMKNRLSVVALMAIVPEVCALVIVILITKGIFTGSNTLGDYTLYTGLLSTLITGLSVVATGIANIYEDKLKIDTVKNFENQENHVLDIGKIELDTISEIEFRNVSFTYPGAKHEVLKDISFHIHKGEKICLVGGNGAGKSTIIKLVLRFYDATRGQILINGMDIREYTIKSVRNAFSTLFQQYDKMAFSLRDNIMLSDIQRVDETDEQVIAALEQAGAHEILEKVDYQLDVQLSRMFDVNGLELSGGELQKIGLARAIYRKRSAIIFDEPSAALDPISETKLFECLQEYLADKTTIFTTHRMNTIHLADRILVVKDGYICEDGTHESLLEKNGIYAKLFNLQAERFVVN